VSAWRQLPKLNVEGSIPFARSTQASFSGRFTTAADRGRNSRAAEVPSMRHVLAGTKLALRATPSAHSLRKRSIHGQLRPRPRGRVSASMMRRPLAIEWGCIREKPEARRR
jgi:hypothetical protein